MAIICHFSSDEDSGGCVEMGVWTKGSQQPCSKREREECHVECGGDGGQGTGPWPL